MTLQIKDASVIRDHICEIITDVMWHEERLWNVGVLQRVAYVFPILFVIIGLITRVA
jgi:hypothetical protein